MRLLCRIARNICVASIPFALLACSSSGGDNGPPGGVGQNPPPPPPPTTPPPTTPPPEAPADPILYIANQEDAERFELWLVDPQTPGTSARVNGVLAADGDVFEYALSPDLMHAAYVADQETEGVAELFLVDLAEPGVSTKLSAPLVDGGDVDEFQFSPDGSQVVYIADEELNMRHDAYLVDISAPGVATQINSELTADADVVDGIQFSPDGTKILYASDEETFALIELYLVDIAAPGVATKVNPPFAFEVELARGYQFSPDGASIVYMSDQDTDEVRELFMVATDNPGVAAKLNGPLVAGGDLCDFKISPDSTHVAYCADQDTDDTLELYIVEMAVPGVSMKLNSTLVAAGDVSAQSYVFSPDGTFLVYRADQDIDDTWELYRVERATPGVTVKVSDTLVVEGDVAPATGDRPSFSITVDGLNLAYIADQSIDELFDVHLVDLANPGISTTLNPPMNGAGADLVATTADSLQVIYSAAQDSDGTELYRVDIATPGVSTKLNGALVTDGEVFDFAIRPGLNKP